jgi:tripartite-type tricarboxylate transporter receptor subunit TctC
MKTITLWLGATLAVLWPATNAPAQEDFYKGKTLTIISGEPPGGAADLYARTLATHIGRHLPGHPNVIVQQMPGASSIISANYLYQKAPRDGTTLLMPLTSALFATIFGNTSTSYKPNEFTWIGSLDQATGTCSAWKGSGLASFEDLLKNTTLLGAVAPSGVASEYPRSMNSLFGTRTRVIHGYEGTGAIRLAMQRGEVQGSCAFMLSALKSAFRDDYNSGQLVPIVQFAHKSPELKDVPHVLDFARTELEKQVFNLVYNRDAIARSVLAPPGIPAERTAMLRAAFDLTIKDQGLIDTLAKAGLALNPLSGVAIEGFVKDYMAAPPEAVARARAALDMGKDENWQLKSVAGTLTDIGTSDFEVKDADAKSIRLKVVEADSTIMLQGKQASLASLKTGMGCFVRYTDASVAQIVVCK